jgi:hypothetical protein
MKILEEAGLADRVVSAEQIISASVGESPRQSLGV